MVRRTDAGVLIVDLTNVPYMDSAGLGCLVGAHVSYSKNSRRLALVGVNQRLRDLFSITQVGQFFRTYANVDDAERDRGTGAATAR
jgi:anti-sigma B factor antagonist